MQTEFEFQLPKGFVDGDGNVHRVGRMRLATAMDEIVPQQDARVAANEAYLPILLLARVVVSLGALPRVTPEVIESLFAADMAYLQDLYQHLNAHTPVVVGAVCPHCQQAFQLQVAPLGEA